MILIVLQEHNLFTVILITQLSPKLIKFMISLLTQVSSARLYFLLSMSINPTHSFFKKSYPFLKAILFYSLLFLPRLVPPMMIPPPFNSLSSCCFNMEKTCCFLLLLKISWVVKYNAHTEEYTKVKNNELSLCQYPWKLPQVQKQKIVPRKPIILFSNH